jgi:hypothetical protein
MYRSIILDMHPHQIFCLVLEINHAEGRGVPPPSHTEATNNLATRRQGIGSNSMDALKNYKLYEGTLPASQRPGK